MCECCELARNNPHYRMFSPACVYCGARMIQVIGAFAIHPADCTTRRRKVLADWVSHGHSEKQIRELVKGERCLQPKQSGQPIGLDVNSASANRTQGKRR